MTRIKTNSNDILVVKKLVEEIAGIQLKLLYKDIDYKFLGKLSELTDEDCEKFVRLIHDKFYMEEIKMWADKLYENYNQKSGLMNHINRSSKQSFISLLQSNGIDTTDEDELLIIEIL